MKKLDERTLLEVACEAGLLLNEAIRELAVLPRMHALTENIEEGPIDIKYLAAVRHILLMSVVINLYRLKETRDHFLVPWLFSDSDLRKLSFPPVEEFIGNDKWSSFETVRNQYAGHSTKGKPKKAEPGRIVPASRLGRALRDTGLNNLKVFLWRVVEELGPGIENVRAELTRRYPKVEGFIKDTYPLELERAKEH